RRLAAGILMLAYLSGFLLVFVVHESALAYPVLIRLVGPASLENPAPLRHIDPTCRLRGWRATLAVDIDRLRADLRREGKEPIVAGTSWNVPGELGVYCEGHPQVYCLGWAVGERHSQYDLWPNPFDNPNDFKGQTFIIV